MEECVCDPFLTHFGHKTAHFQGIFGIFPGREHVTAGSKHAKNTCLSTPNGLGTFLGRFTFFASETLVDPTLAPAVRCPLAAPSDQWYGF